MIIMDRPNNLNIPKDKKFVCSDCGHSFTRRHNLKSHQLTHSKLKPYNCPECHSQFRRSHDLKRHKKSHTGEKPFQCLQCRRTFARSDALVRHTNSQAGCGGNVITNKSHILSATAKSILGDAVSLMKINSGSDGSSSIASSPSTNSRSSGPTQHNKSFDDNESLSSSSLQSTNGPSSSSISLAPGSSLYQGTKIITQQPHTTILTDQQNVTSLNQIINKGATGSGSSIVDPIPKKYYEDENNVNSGSTITSLTNMIPRQTSLDRQVNLLAPMTDLNSILKYVKSLENKIELLESRLSTSEENYDVICKELALQKDRNNPMLGNNNASSLPIGEITPKRKKDLGWLSEPQLLRPKYPYLPSNVIDNPHSQANPISAPKPQHLHLNLRLLHPHQFTSKPA